MDWFGSLELLINRGKAIDSETGTYRLFIKVSKKYWFLETFSKKNWKYKSYFRTKDAYGPAVVQATLQELQNTLVRRFQGGEIFFRWYSMFHAWIIARRENSPTDQSLREVLKLTKLFLCLEDWMPQQKSHFLLLINDLICYPFQLHLPQRSGVDNSDENVSNIIHYELKNPCNNFLWDSMYRYITFYSQSHILSSCIFPNDQGLMKRLAWAESQFGGWLQRSLATPHAKDLGIWQTDPGISICFSSKFNW